MIPMNSLRRADVTGRYSVARCDAAYGCVLSVRHRMVQLVLGDGALP